MNIIKLGAIVVTLGVAVLFVITGGPNLHKPAAAPLPNGTILWLDVPTIDGSTPDINSSLLINQAPPPMSSMELYIHEELTEVAAFYSDGRMNKYGWSPQPYGIVKHFSVGHGEGGQIPSSETAGGCDSTFTFHGQPAIDCTFSKTDSSGKHSELTIDIISDNNTHQTEIDYTRFESKETPNAPTATTKR